TAFRLEALPDPSLPSMGPGRAGNGKFVLNEFQVRATAEGGQVKPVVLHKATATFSQDGWAVAGAIDGNPATGSDVSPQFGRTEIALFDCREPIAWRDGATLVSTLDQQWPGRDHSLGRFRLAVTTAKNPVMADGLPAPVLASLKVPAEQRSAEHKATLVNH